MKIKIENLLKRVHKGEAGFEGVLVMPLVFVLLMILIIFFFTGITYVSYNNMANTIAQHLDMRATGYNSTKNTVLSSDVTGGTHYNVDGHNTVNGSDIRTYAFVNSSITAKQNDNVLLGGLNAAINSIASVKTTDKDGNKTSQLNMPFTAIKSITAMEDRSIDLNSSRKNAGNTIKVIVEYYPISFLGSVDSNGNESFGALTMKAVGYATIS